MNKRLGIIAILGALAIVLGAFGAHALKETLSIKQLASYETGVRYMFYHVFALLIVNVNSILKEKAKKLISILFFIGITLFSGSIFLLVFGLANSLIGICTPIGGVFFILGWLVLAFQFFQSKASK